MTDKINSLRKIKIGGIDQWILIRGNDSSKPLLLLVQAGPGFPLIHETDYFEKKLHLENHFVCVYWDQRGCGKSYSKNISPDSLTLEQMVTDTNELTAYLKQQFNVGKIFIVGFSLGGTIAALSAFQIPENYRSVFVVGIDVKMDAAEQFAYSFAIEEARKRNNRKAIKELLQIGSPPHMEEKKFLTRVKWITNFGGVNRNESYNSILMSTIKNMLFSTSYNLRDVLRTIQGMTFSQKYLLPRLAELDLFKEITQLQVPVYFLQGIHDFASPYQTVYSFYEKLDARKGKRFITFNNSAHMPHYEESEKFLKVLIEGMSI
ncbi:MAG: alpha/beta fold hydrolase [Ignavibacteriaceae bacterium]|jgi:pimeloyl-ACP methyl ester carboxylesterase|nr:alpha/beta fold hydrolase [Ignavibacteriaceae bacterium]